MIFLFLSLACSEYQVIDTGEDECETAADCPEGQRCYQELTESGQRYPAVCAECAEWDGAICVRVES